MSRYKRAHIELWEKHRGQIPAGKQVHHINGNHDDNRIENLQLVTPGEHSKLHSKNYRIKNGDIVRRRCTTCKKWMTLDKFYKSKSGYYQNCKKCHNKIVREWSRRNKDKKRKDLKAWREAHPDKVSEQNKRRAEKIKKWQAEHAEQQREYRRRYYQENKAKWKRRQN